eukprot:COSAG01_NODE_13766_length_1524_cov_1.944406_2_plen_272_part_00
MAVAVCVGAACMCGDARMLHARGAVWQGRADDAQMRALVSRHCTSASTTASSSRGGGAHPRRLGSPQQVMEGEPKTKRSPRSANFIPAAAAGFTHPTPPPRATPGVGHLLSQFVVTEAAAVAADSEASVRARAAALLWEAGRLQSTASRAAKAVAKQQQEQQQQGQPRAKKKKAGGGGDVRPAGVAAAAAATVRKQLASGRYDEFLRQGGGGGWSCPVRTVAAHTVSRSCACIGSPCLRDCVHGASIGAGAQPRRGGEGPHGVCVPPPPMR